MKLTTQIMTFRNLAASLLMASTAVARTLFLGSSEGSITAYNFDESSNQLTELFRTWESAPAPTWQTIYGNILYSVSETSTQMKGVVTAYKIEEDRRLTKKEGAEGLSGPVSIAVANEGMLLIVAA
jgi:6-phosphogluconolactonase (cycloisomerase 2 family)